MASASPRRHELLRSVGLRFDVRPADVDETPQPGEAPIDYVERVARDKAGTIVGQLGDIDRFVVLAADTTVDLDGRILGKPIDDTDARSILGSLSGRSHRVHTAVICRSKSGTGAVTVTTEVTFACLTDADLDWYLALGEHVDKAGAYGMQSAGAALVQRIDGSPSNVIGLPVHETMQLLRDSGLAAMRPLT